MVGVKDFTEVENVEQQGGSPLLENSPINLPTVTHGKHGYQSVAVVYLVKYTVSPDPQAVRILAAREFPALPGSRIKGKSLNGPQDPSAQSGAQVS